MSSNLTQLFRDGAEGNDAALGEAWTAAYAELRLMAAGMMARERGRITLQPTAVVNEVFLRLHAADRGWDSRRHFFGAAARAMGQYLIDAARHRHAAKRGGRRQPVSLTLVPGELGHLDSHSIADAAEIASLLIELDRAHPRAADVAWLRYVVELDVQTVADMLEVSSRTIKTDWAFARAWLRRAIEGKSVDGDSAKGQTR